MLDTYILKYHTSYTNISAPNYTTVKANVNIEIPPQEDSNILSMKIGLIPDSEKRISLLVQNLLQGDIDSIFHADHLALVWKNLGIDANPLHLPEINIDVDLHNVNYNLLKVKYLKKALEMIDSEIDMTQFLFIAEASAKRKKDKLLISSRNIQIGNTNLFRQEFSSKVLSIGLDRYKKGIACGLVVPAPKRYDQYFPLRYIGNNDYFHFYYLTQVPQHYNDATIINRIADGLKHKTLQEIASWGPNKKVSNLESTVGWHANRLLTT